MAVEPYDITVPDDVLDDLRQRVARSRFVTASDPEPWRTGADPSYLGRLAARWIDGFDWRAQERALTRHPHVLVSTPLGAVHAVVATAVGGRDRPAILLAHGWPSTVAELLPLADRLSDPARFGGDPATARDVVVPSLPGVAWGPMIDGRWTRDRVAELFAAAMAELGHDRYLVFGGDIGGTVAAWMAASHPESVVGLHLIHPPYPSVFDPEPTPEEQAFLDAEEVYDETDGGYSAIMITRPDTVGAALVDSPIGTAAWIADKLRDWSDCGGDLDRRFSLDDVLTIATTYWVTGSIGTSFRQYSDFPHLPPRPTIDVPAAFTLSHEPGMIGMPRSIVERACSNVVHWSEPGRGGHFMAFEEPDQVAAELLRVWG